MTSKVGTIDPQATKTRLAEGEFILLTSRFWNYLPLFRNYCSSVEKSSAHPLIDGKLTPNADWLAAVDMHLLLVGLDCLFFDSWPFWDFSFALMLCLRTDMMSNFSFSRYILFLFRLSFTIFSCLRMTLDLRDIF